MPNAPKRPCNHTGCHALVSTGQRYCSAHQRVHAAEVETRRPSAQERGYTGAWQKARIHFLRAHSLCATHEKQGQVVAATVVDHIVPHKGDKVLFWQRTNWQPLCKPCHDFKTATEDGGFGRSIRWNTGGA